MVNTNYILLIEQKLVFIRVFLHSNTTCFTDSGYIKNHRPDSEENYVFICQKTRRRYSSSMLYYIVAKYFDKAGVDTKNRKHGPHALRHSLATNLLKGNSPMPVITGILGHKNLNTTSKYLSIDVDSLRKCSLEVTDE